MYSLDDKNNMCECKQAAGYGELLPLTRGTECGGCGQMTNTPFVDIMGQDLGHGVTPVLVHTLLLYF